MTMTSLRERAEALLRGLKEGAGGDGMPRQAHEYVMASALMSVCPSLTWYAEHIAREHGIDIQASGVSVRTPA